MKRRKAARPKSPLIRLVGLEAAVATAGIAGSMAAVAAPGDLDPSFGDVGRMSGHPLASSYSSLWSVDVQADDSVVFGGGSEYYGWYTYEDYFIGRLLPNGAPDASFAAAALTSTAVYDTAVQPDGKVVGVGTARQTNGHMKLVVFRLRTDGSLDPDFGLGGRVVISDGTTSREAGYSVLVDADGRIVVAGERGYLLLVTRLLANGVLDAGFGTAGVFIGREVGGTHVRIAAGPAGGYRVVANFASGGMGWECAVAGLTAAGGLEPTYGSGGYASPPAPGGEQTWCTSMAVLPDGRVALGGTDGGDNGYVGRLLANGTPDPAFNAALVPGRFKSVSALAAGAGGSIFVTGTDRTGFSGALVVRLLADGTLDTLFGRGGSATVDLNNRRAASPIINDMKVVSGGALIVGGNTDSASNSGGFVARLLGDSSSGGPGVVGLKQSRTLGTEQAGQVVLAVQRTGGGSGAIAVAYSTRDHQVPTPAGSPPAPGALASGGADYTATTGRLTWGDGDVSDREIVVPIASDTNAEPPEFFEIVLESPEGGAGLAAYGADLEIAGASYPYGDFRIFTGSPTVSESALADFYVQRVHYSQGAVSVTVRVADGGTAAKGDDFTSPGSTTWQDVVLTWADGESGNKHLPVRIVTDSTAEAAESFTLELVSPTGGAALGDKTQATMFINAQEATQPDPPPSNSRGGGGSFGLLGAMLLTLGGALRRRIQKH